MTAPTRMSGVRAVFASVYCLEHDCLLGGNGPERPEGDPYPRGSPPRSCGKRGLGGGPGGRTSYVLFMLRVLPSCLLFLACCSARSEISTSAHDASTSPPPDASKAKPDSSLVDAGPLPACHWPASLDPANVPDGSLALWGVSRTYVACGDSVLDGGAWEVFGGSDSSTSVSVGGPPSTFPECLMACEPDQYAVSQCDGSNFLGNCPPPDASVVYPSLPSGCGKPTSTFTKEEQKWGNTSEGPTAVTCCPCE